MTQEPQPFKFALGDFVICLLDREPVFVVMSAYPKHGENYYKLVNKLNGEFKEAPERLLLSLEARVAEKLMGND